MNVRSSLVNRSPAFPVDVPLVLASGFMATVAMTTLMFLLPLAGLPQVDLPLWVARLFTTDPVRIGVLGMGIHLFVGLGFAWVYAAGVEPRLAAGPMTAGLIYGAGLWVFVQGLAVPALGAMAVSVGRAPAVVPGLFAARLGVLAAASSLVLHVIYGGALGYLYGCHFGGRCRRVPLPDWPFRLDASRSARS